MPDNERLSLVYIDVSAREASELPAALKNIEENVKKALRIEIDVTPTTKGIADVTRSVQDMSRVMETVKGPARTTDAFKSFNKEISLVSQEIGLMRTRFRRGFSNQTEVAQAIERTQTELRRLTERAADSPEALLKVARASTNLEILMSELEDQVNDSGSALEGMKNKVHSLRHAVENGTLTAGEAIKEFEALRDAALQEASAFDKSTKVHRDWSAAAATASRSIKTLRGETTALGLSGNVMVAQLAAAPALANALGNQLRSLGPAGKIGSDALGLVGGAGKLLTANLDLSAGAIGRVAMGILRLGPLVAGLAPAIAAVGLSKLTMDAVKLAGELDVASHRMGMTVEGIQELQHAARVAGVPADILTTTLQRLQRRAADAASGNQKLKAAFDDLGVTIRDANGNIKDTETLLGEVADGINRFDNNADKLRAAFKVFDTEGGRLLPLLSRGAAGIAELREEARELGLVISGDTVISLNQFNERMAGITQALEVAKIEIGAAFLPVVENLVSVFDGAVVPVVQDAAKTVAEFSATIVGAGEEADELRRAVADTLAPFVAAGDAALTLGTAVYGGFQTIVAGFRLLGKEIQLIALRLQDYIDKSMVSMADFFLKFSVVPIEVEYDLPDRSGLIAEIEKDRDQIFNTYLDGLDVWGSRISDGFARILGGEHADMIVGLLENLASDPRIRASSSKIGEAIGGEDGVGGALEGSLAYAEEQLRKANEKFVNAIDHEGRVAAKAGVDFWEGVIRSIRARFDADDLMAEARIWAQRLTAEFETGLKSAGDIVGILGPHLEWLRSEYVRLVQSEQWATPAAEAIKEQIELFERLYNQAFARLELPQIGKDLADAVMRSVTAFEAAERGHSGARKIALPFQALENEIRRLINAGEDWSVVAKKIEELRLVSPRSIAQLDRLTGGLYSANMGIKTLGDGLQTLAEFDISPATGGALVATLDKQLSNALKEAARDAAALNEPFDELATTQRTLTRIISDLLARYDELSEAERNVLNLATLRLAAIDDEIAALDKLAMAEKGVADVISGLFAIGRDIPTDPLETFRAQIVAIEQALISAGESTEVVAVLWEALAEAQERLFQQELAEALQPPVQEYVEWHDAILQAYGQIEAIEDLQRRLNGEIGITPALAQELVEVFSEALALTEEGTAEWFAFGDAILKARASMEAARAPFEGVLTAVNASLGLGITQTEEWRETVVKAFTDGAISAHEYADAIERIEQVEREIGQQSLYDNIAAGINMATRAMAGLQDAFKGGAVDAKQLVGTLTDLGAGIANTIVPGAGQVASAVGGFIQGIVNLFDNGMKEVNRVIEGAISTSGAYLGESLVRSIAEGYKSSETKYFLGFIPVGSKTIIDEEGLRAGIQLANSIANGFANAIKSGAGFEEAWKSMIDNLLIDAIITKAINAPAVQAAIEEMMALIEAGDHAGAARVAERVKTTMRDAASAVEEIIGDGIAAGVDAGLASLSRDIENAFVSAFNAASYEIGFEQLGNSLRSIIRNQTIAGLVEAFAVQELFDNLAEGIKRAVEIETGTGDWALQDREAAEMQRAELRAGIELLAKVGVFGSAPVVEERLREFDKTTAARLRAIDEHNRKVLAAQKDPWGDVESAVGELEAQFEFINEILERLGFGFSDLTDSVNDVTGAMQNVPPIFKDITRSFDSVVGDYGFTGTTATVAGDTNVTIVVNAPIYGVEDLESTIRDTYIDIERERGLSGRGLPR